MAETRKASTEGFRVLPSYYEAIRDLPDNERLMIYDALMDFGFGNDIQELSPLVNSIFKLIKPTLEKSIRFMQKQKENGSKKGHHVNEDNNPTVSQTKPKKAKCKRDSESDSDSDSESDSDNIYRADKPPRAARFTPPTVEEVINYCRESGKHVDAYRFVNFYESKGWRVGKAPMKNWKAAVNTWDRDEDKPGIGSPERYTCEEGETL